MKKDLPAYLILVMGFIALIWVNYTMFIMEIPENVQQMSPIPTYAFAVVAIWYGFRKLRNRS